MSKTYKKWSANEDKVISRMRKEGSTTMKIAAFLGRSERSVANRIQKLINCCQLEKTKKATTGRINIGYVKTKPTVEEKNEIRVPKRSKIDYYEVAKRVANGFGNIQAVFRQYAKETGVSVTSIHRAYYNPSQNYTRIKDLVVMFMAAGRGGILPPNCKNINEKPKKNNVWTKLMTWLPKSWLS
jgi:predicted transcriptional regulator